MTILGKSFWRVPAIPTAVSSTMNVGVVNNLSSWGTTPTSRE